MKNSILTIIGLLEGNINNFIDFCFPFTHADSQNNLSDLRVLRTVGDQTRVFKKYGIYTSSGNDQVFLKKLAYRRKNVEYRKMMNEINILKRIKNWRYAGNEGYKVSFPEIKKIVSEDGELVVVEKLVDGSDLRSVSVTTKRMVIRNCLHAMENLSLEIEYKNIPGAMKVPPVLFLISFPIYWIRMVLKDRTDLFFQIRILSMFYRQALSYWPLFPKYMLAHKDLQLENIMIENRSIVILDLEMCALSEEKTDLAIVAMYYQEELGMKNMIELLDEFIGNDTQKKKFLALTIYYSVLTLATCDKKIGKYSKVRRYLKVLAEEIYPALDLKYKNC